AGFDPEKPLFDKGARNGMHTFEDATLIVEGHDVDGDDATILDVAPTVLDLLEIEVPEEMDGESLVS
ncbi:MAG: nucleotide pyrophosphatase, partial [Halobacteria archaeon]|nr:nucleotide pyrophosphatase [Halobacteria archaeon]